MRLREIYARLHTENLLDPLAAWFRNAQKSVEGQLMSLSYATELARSQWRDGSDFGLQFSREFAKFLAGKNGPANPVNLGMMFCRRMPTLSLQGCTANSDRPAAYVLRLTQLLGKLGMDYIDLRLFPARLLGSEIAHVLERHKLTIGFDGTAWLTQSGSDLDNANDARTVCDKLGRHAAQNRYYAALGIDGVQLQRPTIYDGSMNFHACTCLSSDGWGQALTLEHCHYGWPLAVAQESQQPTRLLRLLEPHQNPLVPASPSILAECLLTESKNFKTLHELEYEDLEHAWNRTDKWW